MKKITLHSLLWVHLLWGEQYISVDLSEQMAYAYEDDELIMSGRISSGVPEHPTPEGEYQVLEKKQKHKSNLWPKPNGGATMNYMLRLTNTGIAMHLGHVPDKPASHGCVRMENGFAQKLWRWADIGTRVEVYGFPPEHDEGYARYEKHRSAYESDYIIED